MKLYAVAYIVKGTMSIVNVAYYWADDVDHAREQAYQDTDDVQMIREVPGDYSHDNDGQIIIYTGVYENE
jgi:hypothetical protein